MGTFPSSSRHSDAAAGRAGAPLWLRVAVFGLVVLGIVFRFGGLQTVFFWHDEVHTGFAISGTTKAEIRQEFARSNGIRAGELLEYQFPRPDRGTVDTLVALVEDEPRHPPLYFIAARLWSLVFGSSIAALRSFSAVLGLLALPLGFLLCRELTTIDGAPWVTVALMAISPIHVVYSQEARQYMLWVDLLLLATWLLIRATKLSRRQSPAAGTWFMSYAMVLALAFYTHILTGVIALAHAAAVFLGERFRLTASVRSAAMAMIGAAALHLPWAVVVLRDAATGRGWIMWAEGPSTVAEWIRRAVGEAARVFIDRQHGFYLSDGQEWALRWLLLAVAVLCAVWGVTRCDRDTRVYLAVPIVAYSVPFLVSDILRGAWRSTVIRYEWPAILMAQVAIGIGTAALLQNRRFSGRVAGAVAAGLFILTGVVSGVRHWGADSCWNKAFYDEVSAAADYVEDLEQPLIVVDDLGGTSYGHIFSLAHRATDRLQILAVAAPFPVRLESRGREVLVWKPTAEVARWLRSAGWSHEDTPVVGLYRLIPPQEWSPDGAARPGAGAQRAPG